VLDEPFEQLDVAHLASVIRAAKRRARLGRVVLVATSSLDIAVNIGDALLTYRAGGWTLVDRPTYADLGELGESPVLSFLSAHHATSTSVRRFRDVAKVTS
jgi:energy-coupling factor transporter ATP-binding protein EcfA2